jgi:fermentation-respiration switch protein FrsA (DUF1100 family)
MDWGLPYQDVNLTTADGIQLHGWYIPHADSSKVLLFFHGNAGNISHRGASIAIFHRLGLNVFIIDYRGYGKSQGDPDEAGLYRDADAAWQYLTQEKGVDKDNIIIFGRSLGGAVATRLAAEVHPAALILESTFSSARDMAKSLFPIIYRLLIFRYRFNSMGRIKQINCPLLVMHSPDDEIIPFHVGEKLFNAANEPKRLIKMKGDHNNGFLLSQPAYEQSLRAFINTHMP